MTRTSAGEDGTSPPIALYLHVPFCVSVCPYCDFVVYGGAAARGPHNRIADSVAALHVELDLRADGLDARFGPPGGGRPPLGSVYLGGGTPSLLSADAVAGLLARVGRRFGLAPGAEVTLEANPGPDERGDVAGFAAAGINRLSIGAQRLDRAELRTLGRRHGPDDVVVTVDAARAAGIRSVALDLLYDLPGDTEAAWERTLHEALSLAPDHLSLYALTLTPPSAPDETAADHLPVSAGAARWRARARRGQDEDRGAAQYEHAVDRLDRAGYRGYEISNWARPGHESRHNQLYWARRPWAAVGPGAHAFDGVSYHWNGARLDGWLAALTPAAGSPVLPPGGHNTPDGRSAVAERIVLALRTDRGVPASVARKAPLAPILPWATAAGLAQTNPDGRVVLTTRGRLLSNEVFARLI